MFEYWVKFYCSGEMHEEFGLITGVDTYVNAMERLAEYYGDECIEECRLNDISEERFVTPYVKGVTSLKDKFEIV